MKVKVGKFSVRTLKNFNSHILCSRRSLKQHSVSVRRETRVSPMNSSTDKGSGKDHDDSGDKEIPPQTDEDKTSYWLAM